MHRNSPHRTGARCHPVHVLRFLFLRCISCSSAVRRSTAQLALLTPCAFRSAWKVYSPSTYHGHPVIPCPWHSFRRRDRSVPQEYLGALFQTAEDFRVGRIGNAGLGQYKLIVFRNALGTLRNQGMVSSNGISFPFSSVSGFANTAVPSSVLTIAEDGTVRQSSEEAVVIL